MERRCGLRTFATASSGYSRPAIPVPSPTLIRADLDVPVLTFQTETDLLFLQSRVARQDDTDRLRLWEVAGTAHADTYLLVTGMSDLGKSPDAANLVLTSSPLDRKSVV